MIASECWPLPWTTGEAKVASTDWLGIAEWTTSGDSSESLLLLVRTPVPPIPSLAVVVDNATWNNRAGQRNPPVLSIYVPYNILCPLEDDAPPRGVSQWGHVIAWSSSPAGTPDYGPFR